MFTDSNITKALFRVNTSLSQSLTAKHGAHDWADTASSILKIHGLHESNFDFIDHTETFLTNNNADVSIDANANKTETTIVGTLAEITHPVNKLVGYRYLYRQMKEMYGRDEANRLTGEMYDMSLALADSTKILLPYCFSLDASKIVVYGRNFGTVPSAPPKRLSSYIAALNETIHQISNHVAGALAVGSFFFDIAHVLLYREKFTLEDLFTTEKRKYVENCIQSFVHSVNHLSRNALESPFTNVSVFDRVKLETFLLEENMGWYFVDSDKEYVINFILELQRIFLDFMDKGDPLNGGKNYRFPVVTANISKAQEGSRVDLLDEKFIDEISAREIYKYNILVSSGSKVASCCFDGDQKVLSRYENESPRLSTFVGLYNNPQKDKYLVLNGGVWAKAKIVKVARADRKLYKVKTSNGKTMVMTEDHLNPTFSGQDVRADRLTTDDYLMVATRPAAAVPEASMNLTYDDGVLIGAYLGNGSSAFGDSNQIAFSFSREKWAVLKSHFDAVVSRFDDTTVFHAGASYNDVVPVTTASRKMKQFIQMWVSGRTSGEKNLNLDCLLQSVEFRKGIIEGLYATDGGNNDRIYTTSTSLVDAIEALLTSLGIPSAIDVSNRVDEHVYPLFCIRRYTSEHESNQTGVYKVKHNSLYFRVVSIEEVATTDEYVYCFEMEEKDNPYFTLPGGVVTHNCRLLNNFELLELGGQMNSFGGAGISLGSHRVVTINFNRVALEASSVEHYKEILAKRINSASMILEAHRVLIKKLADRGLQPFMKNGWLRLDRMFSTFGVLGIVEAAETLKARFGLEEDPIATSLMLLNDMARDITIKTGNIYNIEQIPGESMAPKLAEVDRLIFGEEAVPYTMYSNQFVPLWKDSGLYERMREDGKYNQLFTGGGIVHFNLGEKVLPAQAKALIEYAAQVGCEHFALNPIYSECANGHTTFGKHVNCPTCGAEIVEYYTRVVGFFVPVSGFNKTRRNWEFPKRKFIDVDDQAPTS